MKKVITYGTYDLLHQGHINLLRRAKALGNYLIVGVTSDSFDRDRGKLNTRGNVLERVEAVKATGFADKVIIEDYVGQKVDDIQKYDVDIFAIGSDWEGRFDYLNEYCKVVYLPRTEGVSSTKLRTELFDNLRLGIIGTGRIARRFVPECSYVNGVEVAAVYNPNVEEAAAFGETFGVQVCHTPEALFATIDAVYVASPHLTHYEYAKQGLLAGRHVLCEIPLVLNHAEARELFALAHERGLVLLEAAKTAFFPAWEHLLSLAKSEIIGEIVDVKASLSKLVSGSVRELDAAQAGGSMTELAPFPLMSIVKLLGTDFVDLDFRSKMKDGVDVFTKGVINYRNATSSITLGLGVKTEGNLVMSGTKGYIIAPSPWWLTNYFEVRYENQNETKKYFYPYHGEGLRYEIKEFATMILARRLTTYKLSGRDSMAVVRIIEAYRRGTKRTLLL